MAGVTVGYEPGDSSRAKTLRTGKTHAALRISLAIRDNGALHTSFKGVISQDFEPNVCTDRVKPIKKTLLHAMQYPYILIVELYNVQIKPDALTVERFCSIKTVR